MVISDTLKRFYPKATLSNDETNLLNKDLSPSSSTVKEANSMSSNDAQSDRPNRTTNVWDGFTIVPSRKRKTLPGCL